MFNLVVLTGRLTADPELKTTASGVSVANFSIAVQRSYRSGEEPITDFIRIVAWRNTADFVCKYFKRGNMIGIEGSIQTRRYQDTDGVNRTAFEVVVNNVQFVESKKTNSDVAVNNSDQLPELAHRLENAGFTPADNEDDLPF